MSEIDSSPEIPKIPENWKFPQRDSPGLKIRQIDLDQRFIAFDLSKEPHDISIKPQYGDYLFDKEGNPLVKRIHYEDFLWTGPITYIDLVGDQEVNYAIRGRPEYFDEERFQRRIDTVVYFEETELTHNYSLANLYFKGQQFDGISFRDYFVRVPNQKNIY